MAINVNFDSAYNIYLGSTNETISRAQDAIDGQQTFITEMLTRNPSPWWAAGVRNTSVTTSNILSNYQFEWRPNATLFPGEVLSAAISNFTTTTTIGNAGARFKITPFRNQGFTRTSTAITFTANAVEPNTSPSTATYKLVGDRNGVAGFYTDGYYYSFNWTGILTDTVPIVSTYGSNFANIVAGRSNTSIGSKTLRIAASNWMSLSSVIYADYPVTCQNGSTPNNYFWCTDFYVREFAQTFNYPIVGRISNILYGVGAGFTLFDYYRLGANDQSGASNLFQCVALWTISSITGSPIYILMRVFEN